MDVSSSSRTSKTGTIPRFGMDHCCLYMKVKWKTYGATLVLAGFIIVVYTLYFPKAPPLLSSFSSSSSSSSSSPPPSSSSSTTSAVSKEVCFRPRANPADNNLTFQYLPRPETNYSVLGQPLRLTGDQLDRIGFPITCFSEPTADNVKDLVFVTAAGAGHINIALDAIAKVQQQVPGHTIYYYDLNENPNSKHVEKIKQLCNVIYRQFNYSLYPPHLRASRTYAFKPAVVHEVLREHHGVFWLDSSIRFRTSNLTGVYKQAIDNGGFITFDSTGHSIFAATHPTMFKYLPISFNVSVISEMRGAPALLIYRTQAIYENIIKWWLLCGLVNDCMAPTSDLYCRFQGRDKYASCHRYDQSAINILAVNHHNNSDSAFQSRYGILTVDRGSRDVEEVLVCKDKGSTGIKVPTRTLFN